MVYKIYVSSDYTTPLNDFIERYCMLGGALKIRTKDLLGVYKIFNRNSTNGKLRLYRFLQDKKDVIKSGPWLYGITLKSHLYENSQTPPNKLNTVKDIQFVKPYVRRNLMINKLYGMPDYEESEPTTEEIVESIAPVSDTTISILYDMPIEYIINDMDMYPSFGYEYEEPSAHDYTSVFDDIEI